MKSKTLCKIWSAASHWERGQIADAANVSVATMRAALIGSIELSSDAVARIALHCNDEKIFNEMKGEIK